MRKLLKLQLIWSLMAVACRYEPILPADSGVDRRDGEPASDDETNTDRSGADDGPLGGTGIGLPEGTEGEVVEGGGGGNAISGGGEERWCGDGECDWDEDCGNCMVDCGACESPVACDSDGVVDCGDGRACPDNSTCDGLGGCTCDPDWAALRCDGTECTEEEPCSGGTWECVRSEASHPDGSVCASFATGLQPQGPPPFDCTAPPGPATAEIMALINGLWGSRVVACPCNVDAYTAGVCTGNAFVRNDGLGYIFYDRDFLQRQSDTFGSIAGAAAVLAHEAGHNLQLWYGLQAGVSISRELGADCFAGYFFGVMQCEGRANEADLQTMLATQCAGMDPLGTPWFAPGAHGTCDQRMQAASVGARAALEGADPVQTCFVF